MEADILYINEAGNEGVLKAHSLMEHINGLEILAGRMPENATECIVDANRFDQSSLGSKSPSPKTMNRRTWITLPARNTPSWALLRHPPTSSLNGAILLLETAGSTDSCICSRRDFRRNTIRKYM